MGAPTPAAGPTVCGVDIGSNTFTCAALSREDGEPVVHDDVSLAVRLSEGLQPGGELRPAAVARGLEALEELARRFSLAGRPRRAVATQALRMAASPEVFTAPAEEILGVPVEIISGEQEALLVGRGAILGLGVRGPVVVVDVGGQSTEISRRDTSGAWHPLSLPVGVVGLTDRFLGGDPPSPAELDRARDAVDQALDAAAVSADAPGDLIAVAGTPTTLARIDLDVAGWDRGLVHGHGIDRAAFERWFAEMLAVPSAERISRFGVGYRRADVFPAGLLALERILARLGRDHFTVSANGLRVGVALSVLEEVEDGTGSRG